MDDAPHTNVPRALAAIRADVDALGFDMSCEDRTGALLRVLAASRRKARLLEIGTGGGVSTSWILDGMDAESALISVDNDAQVAAIAARHLGADPRVTFRVGDAEPLLRELPAASFDLIFADSWPGKFYALEPCLDLLAPGGLYVIDDLLPQANWPDGHAPKVAGLIETLQGRTDLHLVRMAWASGLIVASKK